MPPTCSATHAISPDPTAGGPAHQDMFVKKMRTMLFDTDTGIREGLQKSTRSMEFLTRAELWNLFRFHGMMLSECQVNEIFGHFDHDQDGRIDYAELCHEVLGLNRPEHVRHKKSCGKELALSPNGKKLVKRLKEKIERAACHPRRAAHIFFHETCMAPSVFMPYGI